MVESARLDLFARCLFAAFVCAGPVGCQSDAAPAPVAPSVPPRAAPAPAPVAVDRGVEAFRRGESLLHGGEVDLAGAAQAYEVACDAGYGRACAALGLLVQDGRGTPRDTDRASKLYDRACRNGAGVGCFNLGLMALSGTGVARDKAAAEVQFVRAREVYLKACDGGDGGACVNLGFLYEQGYGVEKDAAKARAFDEKGCAAGEQDACASAALIALQGGEAKAATALEETCKKKSPVGCRILAQVWFRGEYGVEKDVDGALEAAKRGCQFGERAACAFLGALLAQANGPVEQVRPLFERACRLGDSGACLAIASSFKGAPSVAGAWIVRACDIGDPEGCLYAAALPDATDAERAERTTRACRQHFPPACARLVEQAKPLPMLDADAVEMRALLCTEGVEAACAPDP